MLNKKFTLSGAERLSGQKEFKAVFRQGIRLQYKGQRIVFKKNSLGINRLGIVVPKASVKLSTLRNRARRLLKEAYRLNKYNFNNGFDIILCIYGPIKLFSDAEELLIGLLKKAKLMENN